MKTVIKKWIKEKLTKAGVAVITSISCTIIFMLFNFTMKTRDVVKDYPIQIKLLQGLCVEVREIKEMIKYNNNNAVTLDKFKDHIMDNSEKFSIINYELKSCVKFTGHGNLSER